LAVEAPKVTQISRSEP